MYGCLQTKSAPRQHTLIINQSLTQQIGCLTSYHATAYGITSSNSCSSMHYQAKHLFSDTVSKAALFYRLETYYLQSKKISLLCDRGEILT